MDATQQLMHDNAMRYQMQQQQQMMQMHNAPQMLMQPMQPLQSPNGFGTQIIWRCSYDSQNRKVCWRAN